MSPLPATVSPPLLALGSPPSPTDTPGTCKVVAAALMILSPPAPPGETEAQGTHGGDTWGQSLATALLLCLLLGGVQLDEETWRRGRTGWV